MHSNCQLFVENICCNRECLQSQRIIIILRSAFRVLLHCFQKIFRESILACSENSFWRVLNKKCENFGVLKNLFDVFDIFPKKGCFLRWYYLNVIKRKRHLKDRVTEAHKFTRTLLYPIYIFYITFIKTRFYPHYQSRFSLTLLHAYKHPRL